MSDEAKLMTDGSALESLLKRDRMLVLAGLVGATALAWAYLALTAAGMRDMGAAMAMAKTAPWGVVDFALMFLMWAVMMVGMMLPGAAPMILLFATISRGQREQRRSFAVTGSFVLGYVAVWTGFSLFAALSQGALQGAALLSPAMVSTSAYFGGALFIAAGVYQLTPLKHACLNRCRSPIYFILKGWRKGAGGAWLMGFEHGAYCLGCCWLLMGLLFFGGVMNLAWIAAIAAFVLIEKVAPRGPWVGRLGGGAMAAFGVYLLLGA